MTKDLIEKLVSKTSAALSSDDKYTTLPLRRSRQARQSRIEEKNPIFDLSTSLAALDAEIVNSGTARRHSHRFSSARPISLTSGTATSSSANASTHAESQTHSTAAPSGTSDRSSIRPSPTIMSMEARPLQTDAAALPDAGTLFVSGPIPSFSSISSAISLSTACEAVRTTAEADELASSPLVSNARLLGRGNAVHVRRSVHPERPPLLPPQSPPFPPYTTPHPRRMRTRSLKSGRAKRQPTTSRSSLPTCSCPCSASASTSPAAKAVTS